MTRYLSMITGAAIVCAMVLSGCGPKSGKASQKTQFVTIGTGSQTGVYFPTGQNLAKFVNAKQATYGVNLSVESTGGSVFNVNAMLAGDMQFGVVQSDIQYQAYNGLGPWKKDGPQQNLRAVFAIYPELVTLVAADDAGIRSLTDLKGKRVNLDSPGSGTRQNAIQVLKAVGLDPETDMKAQELSAKEAPSLLQDDRIDAFFFTAAHPNGALLEATAGNRAIRFVPIAGPAFDKLIAESPYLVQADIPVKLYPKAVNDADVPTIGVTATLMTTAEVPDEVVYAITKEFIANLDTFKTLHDAYSTITAQSLVKGLSAPIHPGARKALQEAGLLSE